MKISKRWKIILLVVIAVGIFFRFFNIGTKVYWHDEVINSARTAGYDLAEIYNDLPKDTLFSVELLDKYQGLPPEKSAIDTINVLAKFEPQNPPLYYLISRIWIRFTDDSVVAKRSLSAIISLLSIPIVYLLGNELLGSSLFSLSAAAIVAISPFHVLYAQEARPFSLWTLTILLSGLYLLRALRTQKLADWLGYTVTTIAGLYTFPFTLFVVAGHGLYVIATKGVRNLTNVTRFVAFAAVSLASFSPWLWTTYQNIDRMSSWRYEDTSFTSLVKTWIGNTCRLFFDINLDSSSPIFYVLIPALLILSLVFYSVYFLLRQAPKKAAIFIVFLILVIASALIVPDLISGGRRSSVSRYFIPAYLGIQLAVAYPIAHGIVAKNNITRWLWGLVLVTLVGAGTVSNLVSANAGIWWTKPLSLDNFKIVQTINASPDPLLITDVPSWQVLELSHYLSPETRLFVPVETDLSQIEIEDRSPFLLYPSSQLLDSYRASPLYEPKRLDELKNQRIFQLSQ
ncbi:MAG: glycosyltransferase family 39 protein [Cyanobacteria bacterium P01_H01_bin.21]